MFEQRPGDPATTRGRDDVHALEFADVCVDEPHATARDRLPGVPPDHENPLWRREFGDRKFGDVTTAVADDVLLLHGLDELERLRSVERCGSELDIASRTPLPAVIDRPDAARRVRIRPRSRL